MDSESKPIIVTVADESLEQIDDLADALVRKGMKVDRVLPVTGVITGSYSRGSLAELRQVSGVLSVEDEVGAELPPPDSTVQ